LICMLYLIKRTLNFSFINIDHVAILIAGFAVSLLCPVESTWLKTLGFMFIAPLLIWSVFIPSFLVKEDMGVALLGVKSVFNTFKKRKYD
jgi:hypothetical protein